MSLLETFKILSQITFHFAHLLCQQSWSTKSSKTVLHAVKHMYRLRLIEQKTGFLNWNVISTENQQSENAEYV